jgi:hypothetical protein
LNLSKLPSPFKKRTFDWGCKCNTFFQSDGKYDKKDLPEASFIVQYRYEFTEGRDWSNINKLDLKKGE